MCMAVPPGTGVRAPSPLARSSHPVHAVALTLTLRKQPLTVAHLKVLLVLQGGGEGREGRGGRMHSSVSQPT